MEETKQNIEVTPESVTEELKKNQDPVSTAALNFGLYFPEFRRRVYKLSRKSLMRLIVALVGQPLEDFSVNLKRDDERQAFAIGQSLKDSQLVLILDGLYKKNLEFQKATSAPTEQEIKENANENV